MVTRGLRPGRRCSADGQELLPFSSPRTTEKDGIAEPKSRRSRRASLDVASPARGHTSALGFIPALTKRDLDEPLLSIPDIAGLCRVSEKSVRRWIESGRLVARKLGGQWRIHPADYHALLHAAAAPQRPTKRNGDQS